ncbi:3-oxoacyl-[acyl-carrier protein] reductase [Algoriphagus sp. 4150]|uniref:3-ketoacyl-ACP reductase n=1 Tax=Algoriphagus sp. 4150 TaxID=2817756 RepID=UPI0028544DA4|nr:3-ketoacyl-ACP reductase [Algoriphagus sp. 4150]MDR7129238.1 3-oxoacyl-[acyl-carrier protein] reductase [Algoriphagus sp. 4150]
MESLKGKIALITGAGKGLGKAIALALATEGVHLALLSRTESDLLAVKETVADIDSSLNVAIAVADQSDFSSIKAAIASLISEVGVPDILVNNAGIGKFGKFLDLEVNEWENIIKVNLLGVYYVIHEVLPGMLARKSGDIVNVSSTAGQKGNAMTSAYSASKFGLNGLTESLMQEVRKSDIRVFSMSPSTIATDLAIGNNLTDGNPDKVLQPEDFAELLVAHLKLPNRALVKEVGLWSTNP